MQLKSSVLALLVSGASAIAIPQVEAVEVGDPLADAVAAYEQAAAVPVPDSETVIPTVAEAKKGTFDSSDAIKDAIADAVSGGLERRNSLAVPGFTGPVSFGSKTIVAPKDDSTYMGIQTFPGDTSYDPAICARACVAKSEYNVRHAKAGVYPRICRFFDAYTVYKNDAEPLFSCQYYTQPWDATFATNPGQTRSGDKYTNRDSNGYTLIETKEQCVANVTALESYEAQGLAFRVYDQPEYPDYSPTFSADTTFGRVAELTGITTTLIWKNVNWPVGPNGEVTVGGQTFRSDTKSVLAQGFFLAPSSGTFTFSLAPGKNDNWARLWIGDKSYTTWSENNADVKSTLTSPLDAQDEPSRLVSTPAQTFTRGQIYPFTYLVANGGTQGNSFLRITDKAGKDVTAGSFVRPCDAEAIFPLPQPRLA